MVGDLESSKVHSEGCRKDGRFAGCGTTHKIRAQLNFIDETKWKKFSGRRLELIDSFGLSQHKASEQDDNIKQIATILRYEFEYSETFSVEFEKLVTAAVQSVRRNRKRSKKKLLDSKKKIASGKIQKIPLSPPSSSNMGSSCSASNASSSDEEPNIKEEPRVLTLPALNAMQSAEPLSYSKERNLSPVSTHIRPLLKKNISLLHNPPAPFAHNDDETLRKLHIETESFANDQNYDSIVKSIIVDIVNNSIPLPEQIQRDKFIRPSLTEKSDCQNKVVISNNLRKLILLNIHNSRTCLDVSKDEKNIESFANLETLGKSSLKASISFVVESSFSHLPPSTRQYLTSRLSSIEFLTILSQRLFMPATRRLFADLPQEEIQVRVLVLILGSLVKDYGFDASLAPINEVIYHMTLHQYPLVCAKKKSNMTTASCISEALSLHPSLKSRSTPNKWDSQVSLPNKSQNNANAAVPPTEASNTYNGDGLMMLSAISLQFENSKLPEQCKNVPK